MKIVQRKFSLRVAINPGSVVFLFHFAIISDRNLGYFSQEGATHFLRSLKCQDPLKIRKCYKEKDQFSNI